ncbi:MAG: hypothetical protein EBE86_011450 [Hormoscilla sp. GUM202]|nr:hypothetical protein [Hormoscilla sp. GUM202]
MLIFVIDSQIVHIALLTELGQTTGGDSSCEALSAAGESYLFLPDGGRSPLVRLSTYFSGTVSPKMLSTIVSHLCFTCQAKQSLTQMPIAKGTVAVRPYPLPVSHTYFYQMAGDRL